MVDKDLVLTKAGSVMNRLRRIITKRDTDLHTFLKDMDRQESILFNIQMAVQNCIDIAAHIVSDEGFGVPGSTNEMFYLLEENGYLSSELTEKMVKAVGFRNLILHEYAKLELEQVFEIIQEDINDLSEYLKSIFDKLGLAGLS
ncbi:MAG: DUF86 domain-containing protein [Deltaproteobacteria bacterium]|nr:DUF86 domain-containing protein [Deltaproteobacteria bacterium]